MKVVPAVAPAAATSAVVAKDAASPAGAPCTPERGRRGGNASAGEQIAQLLQGTINAHPRCVFADAKRQTHGFEFLALEEAKQDGGLLRGVQFGHRLVKHRIDLFPSRFGSGIETTFLHRDRSPFTGLPATVRPNGLGCSETCTRVEPAGQHLTAANRSGLARQVGEDRLRHVLRQLFVSAHLPQRR